MNRKLYLCAVLALGGSMTFADAPAAPVVPAPAPAAVPPTAPAPAAATPDAPADAPATQPAATLPDNATLMKIFGKMTMESFTHDWNGLATDVGQLQPVHDLLPPPQRAILDGAMATLNAQGVKIPGAVTAGVGSGTSSDGTTPDTTSGTGTPDTSTTTTPGSGFAAPAPDPNTPVTAGAGIPGNPVPPANPETPVINLTSKTMTDLNAKPMNSAATLSDASALATSLKSPLTPTTQMNANNAMRTAVARLLARVQAQMSARKFPAAQALLNQMAGVADFPNDVKQQIAAYQNALKASTPTPTARPNPFSGQGLLGTGTGGTKKHK